MSSKLEEIRAMIDNAEKNHEQIGMIILNDDRDCEKSKTDRKRSYEMTFASYEILSGAKKRIEDFIGGEQYICQKDVRELVNLATLIGERMAGYRVSLEVVSAFDNLDASSGGGN